MAYASASGLTISDSISPHGLTPTCARFCHLVEDDFIGGEVAICLFFYYGGEDVGEVLLQSTLEIRGWPGFSRDAGMCYFS